MLGPLKRTTAINEVLKSRQNGLFVFDIIADPDGNDLEEEVRHVFVLLSLFCS